MPRGSASSASCCTLLRRSASSSARSAQVAQEPAAPQAVAAEELQAAIDKLGDLDYDTRTTASRTSAAPPARRRCRRFSRPSPNIATATCAIARSSCSPGSTIRGPTMRCASRSTSPNDRLRTVAYSFFEHNPDPRDGSRAARGAREGAGRVRPAGAGSRACRARRAIRGSSSVLVREVGRGEDFFRSAVIEALGDYKAQYAFDALDDSRQARWPACRTMRRSRWGRSATSARSKSWPACSARRRGPRSRPLPRRSACSASTAIRTRII